MAYPVPENDPRYLNPHWDQNQPWGNQPVPQPLPSGPHPVVTASMPTVAFLPNSGKATAAMVLGIVGIFTCGVTSLFAIIFGHLGEIETRNNVMGGRGQAVTGLILGYLILAPTIIFFILFMMGIVGSAGMSV